VLEAKPLGPLLVDCLNWRIRYVEPRSRAVVVEASATSDPRWQSLSSDIDALLSKVKQGHNLTLTFRLECTLGDLLQRLQDLMRIAGPTRTCF
jgi:hypothetical protein